jgi:hypothetical protein
MDPLESDKCAVESGTNVPGGVVSPAREVP